MDPNIRRDYGVDADVKVHVLYEKWMTLREDMEQYLEVKHLPLSYPSTNWTKLYIGVGSGTQDYSGNSISTGMDLGPADWCSNTLNGMTTEMHNRRHIQRIEDYSVGGFIVGTIGVLLGFVSIII